MLDLAQVLDLLVKFLQGWLLSGNAVVNFLDHRFEVFSFDLDLDFFHVGCTDGEVFFELVL